MSASESAALAFPTSWRSDLRVVRTLRYAVGTTLAVAFALGIDWTLSYLMPVLALSFLAPPAPRPTVKIAIGFIGIVTVACGAGLVVSMLLRYPAVFVLLIGLGLFLLFYAKARGVQPLLVTMLMITLTVIPVVSLQSMSLALAVAKGLIIGASGAVAVVWLAHALFPDPAPSELTTEAQGAESEPDDKPPLPSRDEAIASAGINMLVVFPAVLLYFVAGLTSVLILVFIALLSMQPDFSTGVKAGKALIAGNVMGGLAAIVVYELLVMVPQFGFLLLLTLFAGLYFGGRLFSDAPTGPLFGMAFSTMLLVVGSITTMFGEADAKVWDRVIQITIAVVYLALAFGTLGSLRGETEAPNANV